MLEELGIGGKKTRGQDFTSQTIFVIFNSKLN